MRKASSTLMILALSIGLFGSLAGAALAQSANPVVVLDPGHGWGTGTGIIDPGEVSGDLVEKEITLDVARQTRDLLERCDVDVYLTHERDDHSHTQDDIAGIVNSYNPTLAVSIHTNSGEASATGTEAWYTVVGYDDAASQALAAMLADSVARQFSIPNRGAKPEIQSPLGELYIHDWNAPSALLELAFLQGDADLLRTERRNFARAIARTLLSFLNLPLDCADHAEAEGFALAVYFPEETQSNSVTFRNDGLLPWDPGTFELRNTRGPFGAPESIPLPRIVQAGETVTWEIPATAPSRVGIHRQLWQMHKGDQPIGAEATVVIVVVPQEAADLKLEIEHKIEEIVAQGQQHLEQELEELRQQILETAEQKITEWVTEKVDMICGRGSASVALAAAAVVWVGRRGSRKKR